MHQINLPKNQKLVCPYFFRKTEIIAYNNKCKYIFTLDNKKRIVIWDKETLIPIKMIPTNMEVKSIAICNNAPLLLITGMSDKIWIHNYITTKNRFIETQSRMNFGSFISIKQYFIVGGSGPQLYLFNAQNGELISSFQKPFNSETLGIIAEPDFFISSELFESKDDSDSFKMICYDYKITNAIKQLSFTCNEINEVEDVYLKKDRIVIEFKSKTIDYNIIDDLMVTNEKSLALEKCNLKFSYKAHDLIFKEVSNFVDSSDRVDNIMAQKYSVHKDFGYIALKDLTSFNFINKGMKLEKFNSSIYNKIILSPDSNYLLSTTNNKKLIIYNLATFQSVILNCKISNYNKCIFCKDSKLIMFQDEDNALQVYNVESGIQIIKYELHVANYFYDFDFDLSSNRVFGFMLNEVHIIDLKNGELIEKIILPIEQNDEMDYWSHHFALIDSDTFLFTNENILGSYSISSSNINYMTTLDIEVPDYEYGGEYLAALTSNCMHISNCRNHVYCGNVNGYITLLTVNSGLEISKKKVSDFVINYICSSGDGTKLMVSNIHDNLFIIDAFTLEIEKEYSQKIYDIADIYLTPNKQYFIVRASSCNYSPNCYYEVFYYFDCDNCKKHSTLLFSDWNHYGFFLTDGRYEVNEDFMADNYIVDDLKILKNNKKFLANSTKGLLMDFFNSLKPIE